MRQMLTCCRNRILQGNMDRCVERAGYEESVDNLVRELRIHAYRI